jgi:hypothetical protein
MTKTTCDYFLKEEKVEDVNVEEQILQYLHLNLNKK